MAAKPRWRARCKAEISAERVGPVSDARLCAKSSQEVGDEFELQFTQEYLAKPGTPKKLRRNCGEEEKWVCCRLIDMGALQRLGIGRPSPQLPIVIPSSR